MMFRSLLVIAVILALALPSAGVFAQTGIPPTSPPPVPSAMPTATPSPTPTPTPTPYEPRQLVPVGAILPWAGNSTPNGWLLADGTCYSQSAYPLLYAQIGTIYGGICLVDNVAGFRVPDLRGRTIIGAGQGSGLTLRALATPIGEETHLLTVAEMPAHDHDRNPLGQGETYSRDVAGGTYGYGATGPRPLVNASKTGLAGGALAHNIMQPSLILNYIINAGSSPLIIAGMNDEDVSLEITPEPYWVYSTIDAGGNAQAVAFAYSVTAGDFMIAVLLLLTIGLSVLSLFYATRSQRQ